MKKVRILSKLLKISALLMFSGLVFSCGERSGLGEAVDLTVPVVKITSHLDNDSVASTFTLKGTVYDNEGVSSLTVDFKDADIHYSITPGSVWQKKTSSTGWTQMDETSSSCVKTGNTWIWSIYVDTTNDKSPSYGEYTYVAEAVAVDTSGNSGGASKVNISLQVDENDPELSITQPDLFQDYSTVESLVSSYSLKDGNVLKRLFNGDLNFSIQQSEALSFKELRIDFDDGKESWFKKTADSTSDYNDTAEIAENITGDSVTPTTYYSKTIKVNGSTITDLRAYVLNVKASEWAETASGIEKGLKECGQATGSGKIIRVVGTTMTGSRAWQRKVLGWFVWWPESDEPWITPYSGDKTDLGSSLTEVYPESNLSGIAQDDDGIKTLSYTLEKINTNSSEIYSQGNLTLSEENAKYSSWAIKAPSVNGTYKYTLKVVDLNGNESSETRWFKTLDVRPPVITFDSDSALSGTSVLADSNGNITFKGTVSDDGEISSLSVVYLNPLLSNDAQNKIKYMSGTSEDWNKASTGGNIDSNDNKVYSIALKKKDSDSGSVYSFSKTFNIFSDLGIGNEEAKDSTGGKSIKILSAQDFIFRVVDGGKTNTVKMISLSGDSEAPSIILEKVKLTNNGQTKEYDFTDIPNFPEIKNGAKAVLSGTWADNSYDVWNKIDKINNVVVNWNGIQKISVKPNANRTWEATVTDVPTVSGTIKVSLSDLGGNIQSVTKSVFIESNSTKLEKIGSDSDDRAYKQGEKIIITLEFTKNTNVTGTPTLSLNNGGTAVFDTTSNGTAKLKFLYTVEGKTSETTDKLLVTKINQTGCLWTEKASDAPINDVNIPEDSKTLTSRNISVDTTPPTIDKIYAITSSGSYKKDSEILFMLQFSENIKITSSNLSEDFKLKFNNGASSTETSASGSQFVIFTYKVAEDSEHSEDTASLLYDSLEHSSSLSIEDEAGNRLSNWTPKSTQFGSTLLIDTTPPNAPVVKKNWDGEVVVSEDGTSFTITADAGSFVEYTLDGANWQTYSKEYKTSSAKTINLSNNGPYNIQARVTDKAGNGPVESEIVTVKIDKGELFSLLSAETYSGTYSTSTSTKIIKGTLTFRKPVEIEKGAAVTLNVQRGTSSEITVPLEECKSANVTSSVFTFNYEIKDGDKIKDNEILDVTDWNFDTVKLDEKEVNMSFSDAVTDGKKFTDNREIYILTGKPEVVGTPVLSGSGSDTVLTVTFDRPISKLGGKITFTQVTKDNQNKNIYKVPAVVSSLTEIPSSVQSYYEKGVNGAKLNSDSTLTNDTTTKYILNYDTETDNETLVNAFIAANKHVVSIPVVSSAVSVSNNGKVLTVNFGSSYKLPVMGADYTLVLPDNMVVDSAQNKNSEKTVIVTAAGVEKPVIRIKKSGYTINNAGSTLNATVDMPETAKLKIDCRTPDSNIQYSINSETTKQTSVTTVNFYETNTGATKISNTYESYENELTLGNSVESYANLTGLKIALSAKAIKNNVSSDIAYEYATRTVLKFNLDTSSGKYDGSGLGATAVTEAGRTLNMYQLQIWIQGGDAPSGTNLITPFPLSWGEFENYKLMKAYSNTKANTWRGQWAWITWDLSAPAYHGFVAGNVPADAQENGPSICYVGECSWNSLKGNYILYPGETIEMCITSATDNSDKGAYFFRTKNKLTR